MERSRAVRASCCRLGKFCRKAPGPVAAPPSAISVSDLRQLRIWNRGDGGFYFILFPSNGLTFSVHLQQRSAIVRSHGEQGRYLVPEVPLQAAGEVVDDALQNVGLVVLGVGVQGERLQLPQAGLEGVMLVHVGLQEAGLAHGRLEAREHERFFQVVVVADPVRPGSDEEEEVGDVFGFAHVGGLVVHAVDAADHGVVGEGHLVRDVD